MEERTYPNLFAEAGFQKEEIKARVREGRMQEIGALHVSRARRKVNPPRVEAVLPQDRQRLARARAHIQNARAFRQAGQRQHVPGVRLSAGMAFHLSSSARSTEATLPSASASGT